MKALSIIAVAASLCTLAAAGYAGDDGSIVDLMVVYTTQARVEAGDAGTMQTKINTWVGEVNTALQNSGVLFHYRLVHTAEVTYNAETTHAQIMQHLSTVDGVMDDVLTMRSTYGADLVHLILASNQLTDSCGSGYLPRSGDTDPSAWGFSITNYSCDGYEGSRYQMAHALGHNFGLQHSLQEQHDDGRGTGAAPAITAYAFGYVDPQNRFRDVMADDCPAAGPNAVAGVYNCPRVPFYSTTLTTNNGVAIGNAQSADAARVLNDRRVIVANFRVSTSASLDRTSLRIGVVRNGGTVTATTPAQTVAISASGAWTATSAQPYLSVTPASGTGTALISIQVANATGLPASGAAQAAVTVTAGGAPQTVTIDLAVYAAGSTGAAFGSFDSPTDGLNGAAGAIAVTGWALDDIGITRVQVYRDPVAGDPAPDGTGKIPVGDATIVAGARPDVEAAYPTTPLNYRAAWGYMLLTNMLPDQNAHTAAGGNGAFRLYAYATDAEGHVTLLGSKGFTADNHGATKPFGTLDTPGQGQTVSGSLTNWGWVLTPQPATVPTDGSTIQVFVDGAFRGTAQYNLFRSDIATLFPGYNNTNGAIGVFTIDTTTLSNGVHTIFWVASDNQGRTDGIGSRYFSVLN
jgi:hypothetical protein